jgi:hypothetical protein
LVILAVNKPYLFVTWQFTSIVSNVKLEFYFFQSWNTLKVSRCVNFHAHILAKWAVTHHVFGSISLDSSILSFIRIKNGNDPHS